MAERAQNLQDTFLNHVRKNKTPLTIFLVNGVKLQGIVTWFDNFCVLLRRDGHSQLVYKHAISTIMPGRAGAALRAGRGGRRPAGSGVSGHPEVDAAKAASRRPRAIAPASGRWSSCRSSARPVKARATATPEARVEEAVGLARAIDLDVRRCGSPVPLGDLPAGDAVRHRQGRGDRHPGRRRRRSALVIVDHAADAGAAAQSREAPGRPRSSTAPG